MCTKQNSSFTYAADALLFLIAKCSSQCPHSVLNAFLCNATFFDDVVGVNGPFCLVQFYFDVCVF